jgi:hypothetical protein
MRQDQMDSTVTMGSLATHQIFCAILTAAVIASAPRAAAEPAARPIARPTDGPTDGPTDEPAGDGERGRAGATETVASSTATSRGLVLAARGLQNSGLITPGQRAMTSAVLFGASLIQTLHQSRRRTAPSSDDGRAVGVRGAMAIDWIYLEF